MTTHDRNQSRDLTTAKSDSEVSLDPGDITRHAVLA